MIELSGQIQEADFEKILGYYQDKGQFHHQTLTVLYLYTSMWLEAMFNLRWRDVYDFNNKVFYPRYENRVAQYCFEICQPITRALAAYMNAANPQPREHILKSGDTGVIGFSFRVIREAMTVVWRCCLIEPYDMRMAFKNTEMYRNAVGLPAAVPAQRRHPRLIPLNGSLSAVKWNKDYETCVTKRDLVRLLNDCLERHQYQSHVILTLYLYSDISVMAMSQIRWRDVYNFRTQIFYDRIMPASVPLIREMVRALLICMARRPEVQPEDFVLTRRGAPMKPNTVSCYIRKAMGQLTDMRLTRFGELRAWARQILVTRPPRRNHPAAAPKRPYYSKIAASQARADRSGSVGMKM
ncbi:MAG: hypothetical protein LBL26_12005 [Peptococcaceae bacterium]|jgi:hypothetical protein|nr:hypothetical protein [Peptococcaceae bacterium]